MNTVGIHLPRDDATEFAYANEWRTNQARTDALYDWLHEYNHRRYHTAIGGPPITRLNNLTG